MSIAENVALVRENMARAARAAGREPGEILLVAATKMNDAERVRQAIAAGVDVCGENRVQEMLQKQAQGAYEGAPLHFIGHLQKNKVKQVVGLASLQIRLPPGGDRPGAGKNGRIPQCLCARPHGNSSHLRVSGRKSTFFSPHETAFC